MTTDSTPPNPPPNLAPLPDADQRTIVERVFELLADRGAACDLRVAEDSIEPHAELRLRLPPERGLGVVIRVAPDVFELDANDVSLRRARVDSNDEGPAWAEAVEATLTALLAHDLVLRSRRTLLGRRVGAVRIRSEGPDQWNGEFFACIGMGRESSFPGRWYAP